MAQDYVSKSDFLERVENQLVRLEEKPMRLCRSLHAKIDSDFTKPHRLAGEALKKHQLHPQTRGG